LLEDNKGETKTCLQLNAERSELTLAGRGEDNAISKKGKDSNGAGTYSIRTDERLREGMDLVGRFGIQENEEKRGWVVLDRGKTKKSERSEVINVGGCQVPEEQEVEDLSDEEPTNKNGVVKGRCARGFCENDPLVSQPREKGGVTHQKEKNVKEKGGKVRFWQLAKDLKPPSREVTRESSMLQTGYESQSKKDKGRKFNNKKRYVTNPKIKGI